MYYISGPEFVSDISLYRTIVMLIPYANFYIFIKVGPWGGRSLNQAAPSCAAAGFDLLGGGFHPSLGP